MKTSQSFTIQDPPLARWLFADPRSAWLWLPVRIWLGLAWLSAGLGKMENPGWMQTGASLQKFWEKAVAFPEEGKPAIAYDWYRWFLQMLLEGGHYTWFAKLVALGETAVGIALIVGAFVGVAAFFGAFMNWHFVMAGTASTNALLMAAGLGLVLAWKTAGLIGLDRYILPMIGTPWHPGVVAMSNSEDQRLAGPAIDQTR